MKIIPLEEFKKGINPYGISYGEMTKGKRVIVDIPVGNNKQMEVEGIITADLWYDRGVGYTSQIRLVKQNTLCDEYDFSKSLYAVYPEKIKKIF